MSAFSVALARRMAAGWMSAVGPTKPPGPSSRQGEAGGVKASGAARGSDGEAGRAAAGFFIQLVSRFARGDFRSFFWIVEGDADVRKIEGTAAGAGGSGAGGSGAGGGGAGGGGGAAAAGAGASAAAAGAGGDPKTSGASWRAKSAT